MQELGLFLKAARERQNITLREAADQCGISNAYINQIENGKVDRPSPEALEKLGQLYQIPHEMLLVKAGYRIPDYTNTSGNEKGALVSILVVDDDPRDRELIRALLVNDVSMRYSIHEFSTGESALEAISNVKPDCVLLDYKLPDMDGLTVFSRIRQIGDMKTVSVIIMTGKGSEEVAVAAMRMGAVNYLTKGNMTEDSLRQTIRHAMRRRHTVEAIRSSVLRSKESRAGMRSSLTEIGTRIRDAAMSLGARFPGMAEDPDLRLIIEESGDLVKMGSDPDEVRNA